MGHRNDGVVGKMSVEAEVLVKQTLANIDGQKIVSLLKNRIKIEFYLLVNNGRKIKIHKTTIIFPVGGSGY